MRSAIANYLIGQFRKPRGLMGLAAGWIMALRGSNRRRNAWAVGLMPVKPTDHVLEIGYGPGLALARVLDRLADGKAVGLDHSRTMHDMARARNREAVEGGRLELKVGSVEDLENNPDPALEGPFDHIYAVNAALFWGDPAKVIGVLGDRLHGGGRIYVTHQPRIGDRTDKAAMAAAESIGEQMRSAGLVDIRIEWLKNLSPIVACVIGCRPSRQG